MNWDAIGALGELAGAAGVILTLFYLAKQIRQNSESVDRSNEYAQANSISSICGNYTEIFSELARDEALAAIYSKATEGQPLNNVESVRLSAWVNMFFAWAENNLFQHAHALGYASLDEQSLLDTMSPYVRKLISIKSVENWWAQDGANLFTIEFREYVESLRNESAA
jgi:hypothetical protein